MKHWFHFSEVKGQRIEIFRASTITMVRESRGIYIEPLLHSNDSCILMAEYCFSVVPNDMVMVYLSDQNVWFTRKEMGEGTT